MSARRHEQQTRTSDSDHGVLDVFGFLSVVLAVLKLTVAEYWSWWGDAAIPGVSGPQRGVSSGRLPMLPNSSEAGTRLMNNSPKTQQLFFYFDLVHVFDVRFDKPWPTCYRGFHFLTKRTQVCAYAEVGQRPDQNSLAFLPYHAHTCWHFASSRPPTL